MPNESFKEWKEIVAEYRVVESTSLGGLTEAINERLKLRDGWEPFGPLYVTLNARYIQPIIRRQVVQETYRYPAEMNKPGEFEVVERHELGGSD